MTNLTREEAADIMQTSMEQMLEAGRILVMFDPGAADSLAMAKTAHEMAIAALREKPGKDGGAGGNDLHVAAAMLALQGKGAYQIGDVIRSKHTNFGQIEWRVIGLEEAAGDDGEIIVSMTLHNTVPVIGRCFDIPDMKNPWGRNEWPGCEARRYLNTDFLEGFSPLDQDAISDSRNRTYSPSKEEFVTTRDKLFLLSASEIGFTVNDDDILNEGVAYPYYKGCDKSRRQYRNMDEDSVRIWLRSSHPSVAYHVRNVITDGSLSYYDANLGIGLAPACVIRASYISADRRGGRQV